MTCPDYPGLTLEISGSENTLRRNFPAKSWFSFAALQCGERKKRLMKQGKWAGTKIRNPFTKIERRVRSALGRSSSAKARRRVKTGVENPSIRDEVLFSGFSILSSLSLHVIACWLIGSSAHYCP